MRYALVPLVLILRGGVDLDLKLIILILKFGSKFNSESDRFLFCRCIINSYSLIRNS